MAASGFIGLVDVTFDYFRSLGAWHKDPTGVEAVRLVRDRMVRDLEVFDGKPSKSDLAELCREWRGLRIEITGEATYPPDMFIESVCQVIEIS
jgi:hypothetical protein